MKDYSVSHTNTNGSAFPDTEGKNSSTPLTPDGTEYIKDTLDDVWGAAQALMFAAGLTPSGSSEIKSASQRLEAIVRMVSLGVFFADGGIADAYDLTATTGPGTLQAPTAYYDGMQISFFTANVNTGASTVDVSGLGAKDLQLIGGTVLPPGTIRTDKINTARYNLAGDRFELEGSVSDGLSILEAADFTSDATVSTGTTDLKTKATAAGFLGANGYLKIKAFGTVSGVNDAKTITIGFAGEAALASFALAAGQSGAWEAEIIFGNGGSESVQNVSAKKWFDDALLGQDVGANTVDTSIAKTLKVQGQTDNALDSVTCEGWSVERVYQA